MGLEEHREPKQAGIGVTIITVSDTRRGREDSGGGYLVEALEEAQHEVHWRTWVPDERLSIKEALAKALSMPEVEVVLFTGGTGLAPRDVTSQVLQDAFELAIPGFGELFRMLSYEEIGPATILSRASAGVILGRLICSLPGSPKALRLAMERILLPELHHLVNQIQGR
ncbi:MAG TPA: molybdenum cofactor biosynthesis protein B [Planctomycetota bacterium]|nr:molybdenum cofactor biosynthesis protein B [Planctomycetota bacterium]